MCAECHSTGVHKNYDAKNDRFATTWAEISVGCEACTAKVRAMLTGLVIRKGGGLSQSSSMIGRRACWFASTSARISFGTMTRARATRYAISLLRSFAKKSRHAAVVTPAAASFPRIGYPDDRFRTPTSLVR